MTVSFIHFGNATMASYRYRVATPAVNLGWGINETADHYIFAKPTPSDVELAKRTKDSGCYVIADFCDDHFTRYKYYREMLDLADVVTCPTVVMRELIASMGKDAEIVIDPYLYAESKPHCAANMLVPPRVLWFGHAVNIQSLKRVFHTIDDYDVRVVTNVNGFIPWSEETVLTEMAHADIVILPATDYYKSPNRALEAIRSGCMVIAEPHPSLVGLPIYIGDIREGIEWTRKNRSQANEMIAQAQLYITKRYSPKIQACAWKKIMGRLNLMSDAGEYVGQDGQAAIYQSQPMSCATSENSPTSHPWPTLSPPYT